MKNKDERTGVRITLDPYRTSASSAPDLDLLHRLTRKKMTLRERLAVMGKKTPWVVFCVLAMVPSIAALVVGFLPSVLRWMHQLLPHAASFVRLIVAIIILLVPSVLLNLALYGATLLTRGFRRYLQWQPDPSKTLLDAYDERIAQIEKGTSRLFSSAKLWKKIQGDEHKALRDRINVADQRAHTFRRETLYASRDALKSALDRWLSPVCEDRDTAWQEVLVRADALDAQIEHARVFQQKLLVLYSEIKVVQEVVALTERLAAQYVSARPTTQAPPGITNEEYIELLADEMKKKGTR